MTTGSEELVLDDLYRIEKAGIGRDATDKELFGLIALAREALAARQKKEKALREAYDGADAGGELQKVYVIDQMVRALTGCQDDASEEYLKWVGRYNHTHSGWNDFLWNTGIPY